MRKSKWLLGLVLMAALAPEVFGQGCTMCLTGAMSQGARSVLALNHGVLILLVPPFLMLVGIFAFTFLRRSD